MIFSADWQTFVLFRVYKEFAKVRQSPRTFGLLDLSEAEFADYAEGKYASPRSIQADPRGIR